LSPVRDKIFGRRIASGNRPLFERPGVPDLHRNQANTDMRKALNDSGSAADFHEAVNSMGTKEGRFFNGWSKASEEFLKNGKYRSVVFDGSYRDFSFLRAFNGVVEDVVIKNTAETAAGIELIRGIKRRRVANKTGAPIQFRDLQHLEQCDVHWKSEYATSLFSLPQLRRLVVRSFSADDFMAISPNDSIAEMVLENPRSRSLSGIGRCISLESLHVRGAAKLEKISDLSSLRLLTSLVMENARKTESCSSLAELRQLKRLLLINVGGMEEVGGLTFLSRLEKLEEVGITGIGVVVDWKMIFALPNMRKITILLSDSSYANPEIIRSAAEAFNRSVSRIAVQGTKKSPLVFVELAKGT